MSKGIPKRAAKRDSNERGIVAGLRAVGAMVDYRSDPGRPDLIVGWRDANYLFEVKRPGEKLTAAEAEFFATWQGQKAVVHTIEEALHEIGAIGGSDTRGYDASHNVE